MATLAVIPGCASAYNPSAFLDGVPPLKEGKYFKQEYLAGGTDFSQYRKIKVMPVQLSYLEDRDRFSPEELDRLAELFHEELENRLRASYKILNPGQDSDRQTLVVTPALVQVKTPMRVLNAATTVLVFVPVTSGSAAFEAKITDGFSGKLLAVASEKRTSGKDTKSLTVGAYAKFTHAESAFKEWAEHLSGMLADWKISSRVKT